MISPIERCKKSARIFLEEAFQTTVNIEELPKMKEDDKRFNVFTNIMIVVFTNKIISIILLSYVNKKIIYFS